ncbi:hypothetical protein M9H77_30074 [Catharanthus roseus]|uniref:Uncharacterized protein n=1 Tax=Catharanthus roseus TaxID=4058 RepID=A0ACB9ZW77_CATRO|nr:hypothetical protein M9H77_30074 [Catharanthus roseus]
MGAQQIKTWILMKQSLRNRFGVGNHKEQREVQPKVKFIESLMVEEFPKNKELSQAKSEKSLKMYVEDKKSEEESCSIVKEKSIEIKENERVEEKERLVERSRIISKESEFLECSKEKESELEKRIEDKGRNM